MPDLKRILSNLSARDSLNADPELLIPLNDLIVINTVPLSETNSSPAIEYHQPNSSDNTFLSVRTTHTLFISRSTVSHQYVFLFSLLVL